MDSLNSLTQLGIDLKICSALMKPGLRQLQTILKPSHSRGIMITHTLQCLLTIQYFVFNLLSFEGGMSQLDMKRERARKLRMTVWSYIMGPHVMLQIEHGSSRR